MTKNEALKAVAKELTDLSEAVLNLVDATPAKEEPTTIEEEPKAEAIKLEDVRAVLADISRAGKVAEMKALLAKFGVIKLSDVDPLEYPALLAEAKKIAEAVNA